MNKAQTHKQLKELKKLVEQWTRADVMSRVSGFGEKGQLVCVDFAILKLDKEKEIRELLFGTSEIYILAERWNMIPPEKPNRRKNKKVL